MKIKDKYGLIAKTETAVCLAHLVTCCIGFPFMLEGIMKSVGRLVDKLWTWLEYQLFHLEQSIQRWLILSDLVQWRVHMFEYIYINNTHLDSANQPSLIIIKSLVANDYGVYDNTSIDAPAPGTNLSSLNRTRI